MSTVCKFIILKTLRWLTPLIPPILHASGLINRLIRPLYCRINPNALTIKIWDNIKLTVDPCDCIGDNLLFTSHLYNRWERRILKQYLELDPDMTFVDVGANIGAYSLWASKFLGINGRIVSIEANPETFKLLKNNIN